MVGNIGPQALIIMPGAISPALPTPITAPSMARRVRDPHRKLVMRAAVFFATRQGQTATIAKRVAIDLRASGIEADVYNVRELRRPIEWGIYDTALVAASVHVGHHEHEMLRFVRDHRRELERLDAGFLSVSLSEAGAEDRTATAEMRRTAAADAQRMINVFIGETGWRPLHALPVAGALAYSHYNFIVRLVMRWIARKAGAPTDTSRDYEFTDWAAVNRFVQGIATEVRVRRQPTP